MAQTSWTTSPLPNNQPYSKFLPTGRHSSPSIPASQRVSWGHAWKICAFCYTGSKFAPCKRSRRSSRSRNTRKSQLYRSSTWEASTKQLLDWLIEAPFKPVDSRLESHSRILLLGAVSYLDLDMSPKSRSLMKNLIDDIKQPSWTKTSYYLHNPIHPNMETSLLLGKRQKLYAWTRSTLIMKRRGEGLTTLFKWLWI